MNSSDHARSTESAPVLACIIDCAVGLHVEMLHMAWCVVVTVCTCKGCAVLQGESH